MNDRSNTQFGDVHHPALQKATLDDETLDALVRDLSACATIQQISARPGTTNIAPNDIAGAVRTLRQGNVRALQIRYEYEDDLWSDTLMRVDDRIQIVRVNMNDTPNSPI